MQTDATPTPALPAPAPGLPLAGGGTRHAVVTGCSSGIGLAVAQALLAAGWRVTGLQRSAPPITHPRFAAQPLDLADAAAVAACAAALPAPQALVHAAGLMRGAPLGRLDAAEGARMWQLHVQAACTLADAWLPAMAQAGWGRVVLIGSRTSRGVAGRSQYTASKAAMVALARSWAAEVVARGVTVNLVSPAATDTPMLADPARAGTAPRLPPIGRLILPDEVAALVAYLLSEAAAPITGQDIAVCGGASLG